MITSALSVAQCQQIVASERWTSKVLKTRESGCWLWVGWVNRGGYGQVSVGGRKRIAHRVAFVAAKGTDIPAGLTIDHLCRERSCCNPDHLEAVSMKENTLRGTSFSAEEARRTHCPRGHALTADNIRNWDLTVGRRRGCQACQRERIAIKSAAHHALGISQRRYVSIYGQSRQVAEQILCDHGIDPQAIARACHPETSAVIPPDGRRVLPTG